MADERVVILYCHSYFAKPLFDKLLYLKTFPILLKSDTPAAFIAELQPQAIFITGSPSYVNDPTSEKIDPEVYGLDIPVMGICYGMQRMAVDLEGGRVKRMASRESEDCHLDFTEVPSILFRDFTNEGAPVWMVHTCKVTEVPLGFEVTAATDETPIAAMENVDRGLYGVQFHPEFKGRTPSNQAGTAIIWSFLEGVCGCVG